MPLHSRALQGKCPDSGVECVGDVENVRIIVDEQPNGVVEPHFGRRPLLAVEPRLARAGDSRDRALWIDLADHAVVVVGYVHVSLSIEFPSLSTAMPHGSSKAALMAGPPSPE